MVNIKKENKLERQKYNFEHNLKEYLPEEFEGDLIECNSCSIMSSDDSWKKDKKYNWVKELKWFECYNCEKMFCSRCVIDWEFVNDLVRDEKEESRFRDVKDFIDKGKLCYNCFDSESSGAVDMVDIWKVLKANNILLKDEKVLELEPDADKWENF